MSPKEYVDVFPIYTSVFGMRPDWFDAYTSQFIRPSYLLMILLLVVAVGVMALRRFEDADFGKKLWGIPVIMVGVFLWPSLVLGMKSMVDSFNSFLMISVFRIPWNGFGFPSVNTTRIPLGWSIEGLAYLLPNLSYWIIYVFHLVFLFFYSVLGPLIIAKGILSDEIEGFLEMVGELAVLLLWQTTMVVLVAFIMPQIVSGEPLPAKSDDNFVFLSLILGLMILFVPSLTRKLVTSVSSSFVPLGFRWGGAFIGATLLAKAGGSVLGALGASHRFRHGFSEAFHMGAEGEEFAARYGHRKSHHHLEHKEHQQEHQIHELHHELEHAQEHEQAHGDHGGDHGGGHGEHAHGDEHGHEDKGLWTAATDAKKDSDHH